MYLRVTHCTPDKCISTTSAPHVINTENSNSAGTPFKNALFWPNGNVCKRRQEMLKGHLLLLFQEWKKFDSQKEKMTTRKRRKEKGTRKQKKQAFG